MPEPVPAKNFLRVVDFPDNMTFLNSLPDKNSFYSP